jgi:hypothetical protein
MALPNPGFHLEVDADLSTLVPKSHLSSNFFIYLQNFKADQRKKNYLLTVRPIVTLKEVFSSKFLRN